MCPKVSAPASPHSGASGIAPMPAPSKTINKTRLKGNELGIKVLLFRRVVAIARADDCLIFQAAHFEFDGTILSVTSFVGWIVPETVLRADIFRHLCKRGARISEGCGDKTPATRNACELIHLAAREIVKLAADRHPLKRTHLAKAVEIVGLRFRVKDLAVTLYLSL